MSYLGAVNGLSAAVSSILALSAKKYWSPLNLFALGEKGAWFDPSDISTLFQDSAGTTPVTAVEQPVGLMKDKSGNGKDALQATAGNRPTYRARYNLLTFSEQFDNAAWVKTGATVQADQTTDPLGGNTADQLAASVAGQQIDQTVTNTSAVLVTVSCYLKRNNADYAFLQAISGANAVRQFFNIANGTVATSQVFGSGFTKSAATITSVGNGWYRATLTANIPAANFSTTISVSTTDAPQTVPAGTLLYMWGADARFGSSAGTYQQITTATSYNAVGFLPYLAFNGTSSAMATASIPFTAAQMSTFVGVDTIGAGGGGFGIMIEAGPNTSSNPQSFVMHTVATTDFVSAASGTAAAQYVNDAVASTLGKSVLTTSYDVSVSSASTVVPRRNGAALSGTNTPGSFTVGTFGSNVLNIGARGGTTLQSNMNLYGLIVRGASSTAAEIASTEAWMNSKAQAY